MPESRDRISRQFDILATFSNPRRVIRNSGEFIPMEAEVEVTWTPFLWRGASMMGTPRAMVVARRRGGIGTPRIGRSPASGRPTLPFRGKENISPVGGSSRGRGRRGGSMLPSWYPRKPFRDITAVVKAIERRKARRVEGEGLETENPVPQDQTVHDPSASTPVAQLEQDISTTSPLPMAGLRHGAPPPIGKVPLLSIGNQSEGDSTFLTPQRKLLNNIETVERVVMEELQNLKRTPTARKAEREKKVRTLLSLR